MRTLVTITIAWVLMLVVTFSFARSVPPVANMPEDCDCASADGACSVSISCRRGCLITCRNDGNCFAECLGSFASMLRPETTNSPASESVRGTAAQLNMLTAFTTKYPVLTVPLNRAEPAITEQRSICSCARAPGRTAEGKVNCPDGCTSFCGSGDSCYLSCRSGVLSPRITVSLVHKTGNEIAADLSKSLSTKVAFVPYPRNVRARYDVDIRNDDGFNVLNYLNKQGKVTIGGVDFGKLRELLKEVRKDKISATFFGSVKDFV